MSMTILVHSNYGGRLTNELRILPGVYDDNDPRLFGIAVYLVDNGHAEVIAKSLPIDDPELDPLTEEELALIAESTKTEVVTKQLSEEELAALEALADEQSEEAAPVAKTPKKGGAK